MSLPPVLLIGAGRMGGALYRGWCQHGLASSVLLDPLAAAALARGEDTAVTTPDALPPGFRPRAVVLAVKPQLLQAALTPLAGKLPGDAVVVSVIAGKAIATLSGLLQTDAVIRAMPNTPAAIGRGITAAFAPALVGPAQRSLAEALLATVGDVVWLEQEGQIDAVTAVSGSGPAYVFLLAEALEQAAIARGLPPWIARALARKTVSGAGALLDAWPETDAAELRRAVTSPKGTTEQALEVLMAEGGLTDLIGQAVAAAERRAGELG